MNTMNTMDKVVYLAEQNKLIDLLVAAGYLK